MYNVHPDLNITNVSVSFSCLSTTTYPNYNLPPCATLRRFQLPLLRTVTGL